MKASISPQAFETDAEQAWLQLRLKFLDRLWVGLLIVAVVAVPASVSRYFFTGWEAVYAVHSVFLCIIVTTFLLRKRLSYTVRAVIMIVMMDIAAIGGVLSFSLLGSAWWWLLMAGLLSGLLFTSRIGFVHTLLGLLFLFAVALAYSTGLLAIDFDANEYITLPASWATALLGPVLLTIFGFSAIGVFFDAARELLNELDRRRQQKAKLVAELEDSLEKVKTLSGLVPICMHCKKIRDDQGFWENVEAFVGRHTNAQFSHALCQPCGVELYGELWQTAMDNRRQHE
jgi:hypothetical protein